MMTSPKVRLAHSPWTAGDKTLRTKTNEELPSLLISFVYLEDFLLKRNEYQISEWVMDSGAFSAHNSGAIIHLDEYIETCKHLMETDKQLKEIFALDVIGDWKASQKNTEAMWDAGVPAIPCYHSGEPEKVLIDMAKQYPKIALGGVAMSKGKRRNDWAAQCFARVYPKKIHGFAFASRIALMSLPFHTTDATTWSLAPCKFGEWCSFDRTNFGIRGNDLPLRCEINHFLELQRDAQSRWETEMKKLDELE
tara:strand:- start:793 stop:1545 length:753 start_codon:yes stop_codon:yes gene_type:complete